MGGCFKVCVRVEERREREGGREGGGGVGDAFPGQLTYHCAQFCGGLQVMHMQRGEELFNSLPCDIWHH